MDYSAQDGAGTAAFTGGERRAGQNGCGAESGEIQLCSGRIHFKTDRCQVSRFPARDSPGLHPRLQHWTCSVSAGACARGQLKIISNNAENEEAQEELDIDYAGESAEIGLNVSYLLDVLTHVKAETVRFSFADASASVLLTLTDNENFKYVVMPMRI